MHSSSSEFVADVAAPAADSDCAASVELFTAGAMLALDSFFCLSMDIMCLLDFDGRFLRTNPM